MTSHNSSHQAAAHQTATLATTTRPMPMDAGHTPLRQAGEKAEARAAGGGLLDRLIDGFGDDGTGGEDRVARSTLISRNITVLGRRTSVRLEPEMWAALRDIARREKCRVHDVCSLIQLRKNPDTSLTAAIRVFLMLYYRAATTEQGHARAGHGDFNTMIQRAQTTPETLHMRGTARRRTAAGQPDSGCIIYAG